MTLLAVIFFLRAQPMVCAVHASTQTGSSGLRSSRRAAPIPFHVWHNGGTRSVTGAQETLCRDPVRPQCCHPGPGGLVYIKPRRNTISPGKWNG